VSPTAAQRLAALQSANELRSVRAELRRQAEEDPSLVAEWILDPPDALRKMSLLDVLMLPSKNGARPALVARLGLLAVSAHVNLLASVEHAPWRYRAWLNDNARWRVTPSQHRLVIGRRAGES